MEKIIVAVISIVVVFCAIFVGVKVNENNMNRENEFIENSIVNTTDLSEIIEDDCTDEWEEMHHGLQNDLNNTYGESGNEIQANTQENITLSPNCSFIFQAKYEECGHISSQYTNIPQTLVNKKQEEVKQLYPDWEIHEFQNNKVVLYKTKEGNCGEHYILRDVEGKVVVYVINSEDKEEEYQKTEISTDYLTETDRVQMKEGLKVYGKENLSQMIEDFE